MTGTRILDWFRAFWWGKQQGDIPPPPPEAEPALDWLNEQFQAHGMAPLEGGDGWQDVELDEELLEISEGGEPPDKAA